MKIEEEVIRNPPLSLNSSCHNDSLSNNCFITFQNILHMLTSIGVKFPSSFHCFSANSGYKQVVLFHRFAFKHSSATSSSQNV